MMVRILLVIISSSLFFWSCRDVASEDKCGPAHADAVHSIYQSDIGEVVELECEIFIDGWDVCREEAEVEIEWLQLEGPAVEIVDADQTKASIVPLEKGRYVFCCKAFYSIFGSKPVESPECDEVIVDVY